MRANLKFVTVFLFAWMTAGCIGNNDGTGKINLNVDRINFCNRPVGETVVWNDVQLRNLSSADLTISSMAVRGDANCAFQVFYPTASGEATVPQEKSGRFTSFILSKKAPTLLRIAYTPSAVGVLDRADLLIATDADNVDAQLVIPMCGTGADASSASDAGVDADAGAPDASVSEDGGVSGECVECGDPLEKGADHCEAGY